MLLFEFKIDVEKYFKTRAGVPMAGKTLLDAIAFNSANAATEMPFFFQEIFELSQEMNTSGPNPGDNPQPIFRGRSYNQALEINRDAGVAFDKILQGDRFDAVVAPTDSPAWTTDLVLSDHFLFASSGMAGGTGYPILQVPAGMVLGLPVGISFIGTAFSEPTLIKLAAGFEAKTHARVPPTFAPSLPVDQVTPSAVSRPARKQDRIRTNRDTDDAEMPHRM